MFRRTLCAPNQYPEKSTDSDCHFQKISRCKMALDSAHWLMIVGVLIGQLPLSIGIPLLAGVFVLLVLPFAYFR